MNKVETDLRPSARISGKFVCLLSVPLCLRGEKLVYRFPTAPLAGCCSSHEARLPCCWLRRLMQALICSVACFSARSEEATLCSAKNLCKSSRVSASQEVRAAATTAAPLDMVIFFSTAGQFALIQGQATP